MVERIHHANTLCTVGQTNFSMRLNPVGMALIAEIDPTAWFDNHYDHLTLFAKIRIELGIPKGALGTVEGFSKLWEHCVGIVKAEDNDGFRTSQSSIGRFISHGFPYEVDCSNDSPLVGWFLVLGERNG
jgi:hypothetical protein